MIISKNTTVATEKLQGKYIPQTKTVENLSAFFYNFVRTFTFLCCFR